MSEWTADRVLDYAMYGPREFTAFDCAVTLDLSVPSVRAYLCYLRDGGFLSSGAPYRERKQFVVWRLSDEFRRTLIQDGEVSE